jgi:predicted amidohydrolase
MIVGPVGEILAQAGDEPGFITATLDLAASDRARASVPAIRKDRAFSLASQIA